MPRPPPAGDWKARLGALWTLPEGLPSRVRWLFLLISLLSAILLGPSLGFIANSDWLAQAGGGLGLLWLGVWWTHAYVGRRPSRAASAFDGLALLLVGEAIGDPSRAIGLFYGGLAYRSLGASPGGLLIAMLAYYGAFVGASALGPEVGGGLSTAALLGHAAGFVQTAVAAHLLGTIVRQHELAAARERILVRAEAALTAAPSRDHLYSAAIEAALELVGPAPDVRVAVAEVGEGRLAVVAARGDHDVHARGGRIDLQKLSSRVGDRLGERRPFEIGAADVEARRAWGFDPKRGNILVTPLVVEQRLHGIITLEGTARRGWPARELERLAERVTDLLATAARTDDVHRSEARFRSLVQNSSDVITIVGGDGMIHYQSPSITRDFGYDPSELAGTRFGELVHPDDAPRLDVLLAEARGQPGVTASIEARMRHRSGAWIHTETIANNLLDDPSVGGLVLNTRDVDERKAQADQLIHQAYHDPLTGLPNRALFRDRLEAALARAAGRKPAVAVLFLDLDNFKVVNDSLGHEIGDQLLVAVAGRLRSCVRPQDTVARLGGDEFTILLEDVADADGALNVARRIGERLRNVFSLGGREVFATASIGIALSTPTHDRPEYLLRDADVALYRAKSSGKARYEVFDLSMGVHAWERLALETGLGRAVERGELLVYYQPIADLRTGAISGVEALVRWDHPQRGLLSPAAFIPLAEENGLILGIGRWVLEEACRRASEWHARHPTEPPLVMSVNLSARQLQDSDLLDDVAHALQATGLDPRHLKLEITESAAMENLESTIAMLHQFRAAGIGLAMDDFGTGYSSLSYLKRFPIDTLKIDRSFVKGFGAHADDTAIVRAVVAFAQSLNLSVTAEGVETSEQLAQLRAAGCDYGQGYYFAQPRPWEEVSALLGTMRSKLRQSGDIDPWLRAPASAAS